MKRSPLPPNADDLHCRKCGDDGRWKPEFVWGWNVLCPTCYGVETEAGRIRIDGDHKIATGAEYLK